MRLHHSIAIFIARLVCFIIMIPNMHHASRLLAQIYLCFHIRLRPLSPPPPPPLPLSRFLSSIEICTIMPRICALFWPDRSLPLRLVRLYLPLQRDRVT
jgi:hypothetical protein